MTLPFPIRLLELPITLLKFPARLTLFPITTFPFELPLKSKTPASGVTL